MSAPVSAPPGLSLGTTPTDAVQLGPGGEFRRARGTPVLPASSGPVTISSDRPNRDPFPLPRQSVAQPDRRGASRPLWRRRHKRFVEDTLVADAVDSLNALALARAGGPLPFKGPSPPTSESRPTPPQGAVLARLRRCAREHVPPPAESQPDGALQALLQCADLYRAGDRTTREPIDLDKLRVCRERMQLKDVADVVGAEALPFVHEPDKYIAKTVRELQSETIEPIVPYSDPALTESPALMLRLIRLLHSNGLISFRQRARSFVGAFAVHKKGGEWQRLVIDARVPNSLHRRAPYAPLATACAISNLDLSDFALGDDAASCDPHGSSIDFRDGFYQFRFEAVCSWFAFDLRVPASDFSLTRIFNDDTGCWEDIESDALVWPCFCGLPMGWSWALYLCHSALTSAMLEAAVRFGGLSSHDEAAEQIVRDRAPAPLLRRGRPLLAPYVDNGNAIAWDREESNYPLSLLGGGAHRAARRAEGPLRG